MIMVEDVEPSHGGTHTKNKMSFLKEFERYEKQDILRRYNQPTNEDERVNMQVMDTTEVEMHDGGLFQCCGRLIYNNSNS